MSETISSLKQRLVGAFVILSLAIIFLPMLFDKPHPVGKSTIAPVPPRPAFEPVVINKPEQPQFSVLELDPVDNKVKPAEQITQSPSAPVEADSAKATTAVSPASTVERTKTLEPSKLQDKPVVSQLPIFNNVWMVQVGTFSQENNAYALRDKLRADGFDGHTKVIQTEGKKVAIRVFCGPFVNRQDAEKIKKKLDQKYQTNSLILFFDA